jgi:hypothetical protein
MKIRYVQLPDGGRVQVCSTSINVPTPPSPHPYPAHAQNTTCAHLAVNGMQRIAHSNGGRSCCAGRARYNASDNQPSFVIRLQFQAHASLLRKRARSNSTVERSCSLSCGSRYTGCLLQGRGCTCLRLDRKYGRKRAVVERRAGGCGSERRKHSSKCWARSRIKRDHRFELLTEQGSGRENTWRFKQRLEEGGGGGCAPV